ncbi:hypothetical protein I633_21946 (plasmid) [Alteromonas mediterranea 615]|uniref:DUF559 domain-containing protein n=1 Tax=Alteromonas mediterranea 615 TaxID=1300253 RepID=S5ALP9_9ALTE|nr:hypothetical protein I633_21946 [Alteromonas mediterranea 615]
MWFVFAILLLSGLSMRIKSPNDLEGLGLHARKQIEAVLNSSKKSVNGNLLPNNKSQSKTLTASEPKFCEWPSKNPAVWLHIALEKEFKSYWEGGDFVCEMMLPNSPKNWRYDFCLISSRILIEFDGYGFHRTKKAFLNDRDKERFAQTNGWVVFRFTNTMVRENIESLVCDIRTLHELRGRHEFSHIERVGKTFCRFVDVE